MPHFLAEKHYFVFLRYLLYPARRRHREMKGTSSPCRLALRPSTVIARSAEGATRQYPWQVEDASNCPLAVVFLRCAAKGIASSLRGLAPRNDNQRHWVKSLGLDRVGAGRGMPRPYKSQRNYSVASGTCSSQEKPGALGTNDERPIKRYLNRPTCCGSFSSGTRWYHFIR